MVVDVISGGPSERIGIRAGDRIVSVNDTVFVGKKISNEKVMKKLSGPKGTKVKVGVVRYGIKGDMSFDITRGDIPVYSVDVSYIIKPGIGYVKVSKFGRNTYSEFLNALCELKALEAKTIIVDLRGNQGGFLDQAVQMTNEFLNRGELIVYTEGKAAKRQEFRADGSGTCKNEKLIVLIDEWSASASEIFSGAMQDNDRGLIIGRRSFGKGLVQNQFPISDGSAIRLTIARYYTPSGRSIQKDYGDDKEDYYKDIFKRYQHGEMDKKDSIKLSGQIYKTNNGRKVYGGGGIMPDVFVPIDTTGMSAFFNKVVQKGLIYSFAFKYTDKNRPKLKTFATFEALEAYLAGDDILGKFLTYCATNGVKPSTSEIAVSKKLVETQLRAYISRNILDNKGFYPALLPIDETLLKAMEIWSKGESEIATYLK
jgi:carboxyl-terminal processing protease